tara:strand:- start:123 stop:269 length:147 start_codon:yes stop_codon:yes gene_type:complete
MASVNVIMEFAQTGTTIRHLIVAVKSIRLILHVMKPGDVRFVVVEVKE